MRAAVGTRLQRFRPPNVAGASFPACGEAGERLIMLEPSSFPVGK